MATTDPPVSLHERVAARSGALSASERKVALYLADHQGEVAFASAAELGQLTGTSDATVIRTVKALGYDGLPGLKRTLHDDIRERIGPAGRLSRSVDVMGSEPESVLAQATATSIQLIEELQRTVRPESFTEAVKLISAAGETLVLGAGSLSVLGEYFTLRLARLRRRAHNAPASGYQVADDLIRLGGGDVLVLIVHGASATEVEVALDHAASVGAKVVLITDRLGEALADRVAVTLSEPAGETETFTLHAATLTLLDALALAIAAQDRESALEAASELNRIRDLLRAGRPAPEGRRRHTKPKS